MSEAGFAHSYQYLTFFGASLIAFAIFKFWVRHYRKQLKFTNAQALIGKRGLVLHTITPVASGTVKINGEIWSAKNVNEQTILAGSWVIITDVRGAHVFVKQIIS